MGEFGLETALHICTVALSLGHQNMENKSLDIIANVKEKFGVSMKEFQKEVYVNILAGKDVFVSASNGSGKTFCFLSETLNERVRTNMELKSNSWP